MKPLVRAFDKYTGEKIGLLPKSWYTFFDWLCIIASPAGWGILMIAGLIVAMSLEDVTLTRFSIMALVFLPLAEFIKLVFRRPRPLSLYAASMKLKSYSFPSGHAYGAGLGYGYVMLYMAAFTSGVWLWLIGILAAAVAVAVAGARVYLKAHFPSDVTVGLLLGALTAVVLGGWLL